jgi:hypothetical protein
LLEIPALFAPATAPGVTLGFLHRAANARSVRLPHERHQIGRPQTPLQSAILTQARMPRDAKMRAILKEKTMYKSVNGAIIAVALAGASFAIATPASAQGVGVGVHVGGVGVDVGLGNIAFGYQDGYWDNGHQWHNWSNDEEMRNYRNAHGSQFNDYRHDRDPDKGWHRKS